MSLDYKASLDHKLDQKRSQALTPFKNTELNIGDNKTRTATRRASYFLLGAALSLTFTAASFMPQAHAAMLKLGTVDVQIDTTVSVGATMLMKERKTQFLPVVNYMTVAVSCGGCKKPVKRRIIAPIRVCASPQAASSFMTLWPVAISASP